MVTLQKQNSGSSAKSPDLRHVAPKFGNFCKFTAGEKLRLAGIVGFDEGKLAPTAQGQAEKALGMLHDGLAQLGATEADLLRLRVCIAGETHAPAVLAAVRTYMEQHSARCAITTVGVAMLPYHAIVQLDAIASPPPAFPNTPASSHATPQTPLVTAPAPVAPTREILAAQGLIAYPESGLGSFPYLLGGGGDSEEKPQTFEHTWRLHAPATAEVVSARVRPFTKLVQDKALLSTPPGIKVPSSNPTSPEAEAAVPAVAPAGYPAAKPAKPTGAGAYKFQCTVHRTQSMVQIGVVEWKCEAGQNGSDPAQAATFLPPAVWAACAPSVAGLQQSLVDPANTEEPADAAAFTVGVKPSAVSVASQAEPFRVTGPVRFKLEIHPAGSKLWLDSAPGPAPLLDLPLGPKLWVPIVRLREGDEVSLAW